MKNFVVTADEKFLQEYGTRALHRTLAKEGWDGETPCSVTLAFDVTKYTGSVNIRNYVMPSILNDVTELMNLGCAVSVEETHPGVVS